jgi:HlyD family secretion protein
MTNELITSIRRHQRMGLALLLLVTLGLGGWGSFAELAGAVIAPAAVIVDGNSKKVQHLEGGIVSEVLVKNGDRVAAGAVLLKLDPTEAKANLQIILAQLAELHALRARLLCERDDGCDSLSLPPSGATEQEHAAWVGQAKLLTARRTLREGKKQQFIERVGQLEQEIAGLNAQVKSTSEQTGLFNQELEALHQLQKHDLVALPRVLDLERDKERLAGENGRLLAEIARAKVQIGETRLQLLDVDHTALQDVLTELREVESKIAEAQEKANAIRVRLDRVAIVAPSEGMVHNLAATTVGGVIHAGDVIAEIVPQDGKLVLEGRVEPAMIDRIHLRQEAVVRFSSFDRRTTPELKGHVTMIAPDAKQDPRGGPPYYVVQVELAANETAKLAGHSLRPGMPAELDIMTPERTVLSYLLKPFTDQVAHAMKER